MHMYIAIISACVAAFFWPERNVFDVPFSELTLKLIAASAISAYFAYCAFKFVFHSFEEDKFWPWQWTKQIVKSLLARSGMLIALAGFSYVVIEHTKLGPKILDYPIITVIALFIATTIIVCMSDDDIFGPGHTEEKSQS